MVHLFSPSNAVLPEEEVKLRDPMGRWPTFSCECEREMSTYNVLKLDVAVLSPLQS